MVDGELIWSIANLFIFLLIVYLIIKGRYLIKKEYEIIKEEMFGMELNERKEVYFDKYCCKCRHKDIKEEDDPCDECLSNPVNLYSHKPINFKSKSEDNWPENLD